MASSKWVLASAGVVVGLAIGGAGRWIQPEKDAKAPPAAKQPDAPAKPDMHAMLQMAEKMSRPVEAHKLLAGMVGSFEMTGTMSMMPGAEMKWVCDGESKMIIGGRFLEITTSSKKEDTLQIETKAVLGYDTRVKKYTMWSVDSLGTYSISAQGDYSAETKTLELIGTETEMGQERRFKQVYNLSDPEKRVMTLSFEMQPGTWTKVVETVSVRKK